MKKCYIAGKIGDNKNELERRIAMFGYAAELLREAGYVPVDPTRTILSRWKWLYRIVGYRLTLLYDLWLLMRCDNIYKIPGWRMSKGANIESCVAYHFNVHPVSPTKFPAIDAAVRARSEELGLKTEEKL